MATTKSASGRSRRPKPKRRGRLLWIGLVALIVGAVWFTHFRGTGWTNYLNPVYWFHRERGDDLYVADDSLLLHGNRDLPEIALTFDDGPHPESRANILDTLKRYNDHATFFDVGSNMALHPDLVRRTLDEGHEIGNHSENHNRLDGLTPKERHREINDADIIYCALTGKHLALLRPPGMRFNDEVLSDTQHLGYVVVSYTTAAKDFDPDEKPDDIVQRTLNRTENGSILLLHDYAATAQALPAILEAIRKRGFSCVTISEMLDHLPMRPRDAAVAFQQRQSD